MLWREDKLESVRHRQEMFPCFRGRLHLKVVKYKPYLLPSGMLGIQFLQECYEIIAVVCPAPHFRNNAIMQVYSCQKRRLTQPLILIIPRNRMVLPGDQVAVPMTSSILPAFPA